MSDILAMSEYFVPANLKKLFKDVEPVDNLLGMPEFMVKQSKYDCPTCGNDNPANLVKERDGMTLDLCNYCGNIYRQNWMSPDCFVNFAKKNHKKSPDPYYYSQKDFVKYSILTNHLKPEQMSSETRHLDVSCGKGDSLKMMGTQAIGLELCDQHYAYAKYANDVDVRNTLNINESSFDLITIFNYLNFIPEPGKYIESMIEKLTDKGRVVISVPVLDNPYMEHIRNRYAIPLYSFFTKKTLHNLVESCGLEIVLSTDANKEYLIICKKGKKAPLKRHKDETLKLFQSYNSIIEIAFKYGLKAIPDEAWDKIIELNSNFIEAYIGKMSNSVNEFDKIFKIAGDLMDRFPNNSTINATMGSLYLNHHEYQTAIKMLERAERNIWSFDIFNNLGDCYHDLGIYDRAILNYKKAIKLNPLAYQDGKVNLGVKIQGACYAIKDC